MPGKNGAARNVVHNKAAVAVVPDRNGGVHNNGDAADKDGDDGSDDDGHHW